MKLLNRCLVWLRGLRAPWWVWDPLYSLRTYSVGVRCGLGGLWVPVGYVVRVWSLIWLKDSRCKCLVRFVGFVGASGVCIKGVVPCKGPKTYSVGV